MRIIVLGATGMLGYEVFKICLKRRMDVHAIVRDKKELAKRFGNKTEERLHVLDDVKNLAGLENIIANIKPDYIINCIGIVKQSSLAEDYYESIAINSFLPHQLERMGDKYKYRLLHVSTDCVFDGVKGGYKENDLTNANDLYGKSKHLGEVNYGCGITIRTSIIGHEISNHTHGLLEWVISQKGIVKGFTKAIFSGLTTLELTKVMLDIIIPQNIPSGLYQVSAIPISKFNLLEIIKEVYELDIQINSSADFIIDRSLDGSRFADLTGYIVPSWKKLIEDMKVDFNEQLQ